MSDTATITLSTVELGIVVRTLCEALHTAPFGLMDDESALTPLVVATFKLIAARERQTGWKPMPLELSWFAVAALADLLAPAPPKVKTPRAKKAAARRARTSHPRRASHESISPAAAQDLEAAAELGDEAIADMHKAHGL